MSDCRRLTHVFTVMLVTMSLCLPCANSAAAETYFPGSSLNLAMFLAPPPAPDSPQNKAELAELGRLQRVRSPEQVAAAQADQQISAFRFADILGQDKFQQANCPATARLFAKLLATGSAASEDAKRKFARPRPYALDATLRPILSRPSSFAYPSGHSLAGNLIAIVLADLVPEKRAELFARGWSFGMNRALGGVHYVSDVEAGRVAAALVAQRLWQEPEFRHDLEQARAELRPALGLPPRPSP